MPSRRLLLVPIAALVVGIPSVALAMLPGIAATASPLESVSPSSPLRLIAGNTPVTDSAGNVWQPDTSVAVGGLLATTRDTISGTTDSELYQPERYGMSAYQIPVSAPGSYHVQLNESENYWHSSGQRVFSMTAGGVPVLTNEDMERSVGFEHAFSLSYDVTVTGTTLTLGFSASVDNAKVDSLVVTAAAPALAPAPTLSPATATSTITPMAYGAVGDGVTDDSAALQKAFDAATPNRPIVLPAGRIFAHSAVLHLRVAGLHLTGPGTLLATAEATSSVWIEADNVTLDGGLILRTATTTQRWSAWEQMGLRLAGHTGATLRNITVEGSAAAGIYVGGADHFTIDTVTVANTRADGIHMTGGASNGVITNPTTIATGDDGVAVVSYGSDAGPCHDITVTGAQIMSTTGGRGMSVVGGTNITYTGFDIERSAAAGLYIAAEGNPYNTYAPMNVTASGGQITGANTDSTIDHGAIVVLSGETNPVPRGVAVSNVGISDTRTSASRDVGVITYGTPPTGVAFTGITITGGPSSAYSGNTPASSYTLSGWTVNGRAYSGS